MSHATAAYKSTTPLAEMGAKDVDEPHTHTSESVCSSSSYGSTIADGPAATATAASASLKCFASPPIVADGSECVRSGSSGTTSSSSGGGGGAVGASAAFPRGATPTASSIVVGTPAAITPAPVSPGSSVSARRTPAPPPPIDFFAPTPAAGGGHARVAAPTHHRASPPGGAASGTASAPATMSAAVNGTDAGLPAVISTRSASKPPLSPSGLHVHADPFYPERLHTAAAAAAAASNSLSSTPQQACISPCDYASMERHSSPTTMPWWHHDESSAATASHRFNPSHPLPRLGSSPASLSSGPHLPSPSRQPRAAAPAQSYDTPWYAAGGLHGYFANSTSTSGATDGATASAGWTVTAVSEDGRICDVYNTGHVTAAGAEYCDTADTSGARSLSVMRDGGGGGGGPPLPPRGLYASAPPEYAETYESVSSQFTDGGSARCGGGGAGEYDYSDAAPQGYGTGVGHHPHGAPFAGYIPHNVQCIEHLDALDDVCGALLVEAEGLCAEREMRRRQRACCGEVGGVEDTHWADQVTVALDLEGRSLGRTGSICIITLATCSTVFIIDLVLLGGEALGPESALTRVLESPDIVKLMFDCRADCDALFFLYGVRLRRVCDLQVSSCAALLPTARHLPSMKMVFLALGLFAVEDTSIKNTGRLLFDPRSGGSFDRWEERPLTDLLLQYCAVDVKYFFAAEMLLCDYVELGMHLAEMRLISVCHGNFLSCSTSNSLRDFEF
ncbi:3'-5' exonuclease [Novymonas esmeraldas]|uniref:3'-5' exonuclease n=1 Tax=Novymonas esmeraldas TaxID=1808958 RepID=A0AAW0F1T6_9TRYP